MHRTPIQTMPSAVYRQTDPVIRAVAVHIARQPESEHLSLLVDLFLALQDRGVRLDDHLDCIVEAMIVEELND